MSSWFRGGIQKGGEMGQVTQRGHGSHMGQVQSCQNPKCTWDVVPFQKQPRSTFRQLSDQPGAEGGYRGGLWPSSSRGWAEERSGAKALWPQVGNANPLNQAVSSRLRKRVFSEGLGGLALEQGGGELLQAPLLALSGLSGPGVGSFLPGFLTLGAADF